ncbi:phosphoribosyltransferase [Sinomonas atrocyanea]
MHVFKDRSQAGRELARALTRYRHQDAVVLGLPRGGVPVAFEVAVALDVPLDVIIVRKLGVPFQPELAMGAIGEGGVRVLDEHVIAVSGATERELALVEAREREVLRERTTRIRAVRPQEDLRGKTAIVVDDGIATGSTARAACRVAHALGAARVVLAVPVGPADTVGEIAEADEVVCLTTPSPFRAVGRFYRDFSATTDDDVLQLLDAAGRRAVHPGPVDSPPRSTRTSPSRWTTRPSGARCTCPPPGPSSSSRTAAAAAGTAPGTAPWPGYCGRRASARSSWTSSPRRRSCCGTPCSTSSSSPPA